MCFIVTINFSSRIKAFSAVTNVKTEMNFAFQKPALPPVREVGGVDDRQRRGGRQVLGQAQDARQHQVHRRARKTANHSRLYPPQVSNCLLKRSIHGHDDHICGLVVAISKFSFL